MKSQQSLLIPHIFSGDGIGLCYCSVPSTKHQVMLREACIDILTVLLVNRPYWVCMHPKSTRSSVQEIHRVAKVLQQCVFGMEHPGRMQPTVTDIQHDTGSTKQAEEKLVALCMCHMEVDVLYST